MTNRNEYFKYYMKGWRKKNPEKAKRIYKNANKSRRLKALIKINPQLKCKCGRTDINIIEIHHKNGDGKKDRIKLYGAKFYDAINKGTRKIDDLELLCTICNLEEWIDGLKKLNPLS